MSVFINKNVGCFCHSFSVWIFTSTVWSGMFTHLHFIS